MDNAKRSRLLRYAPVAIIFVLGVAGSFSLLRLLQSLEHERAMVEIEKRATSYTMAIQRVIDGHNEVVDAVGGFFESSVEVTRHEFRTFTKSLLSRHDNIQSLEWIPRVAAEERAVFEETARKEGFVNFRFTERSSDGQLRQAGQRDEYFPVYYVEPLRGNEPALGYDLASNDKRREALNRSRDTGSLVATQRITLVQEKGNQSGFLVFRPVYQKGASPDSIEKRRDNLFGFALGVYRIGDMVEEALAGLPAGDFDIYVEDDSAPQDERTLYVRPGKTGNDTPLSSIQRNGNTDMATSMAVTVPGRQWRLRFVPTPQLMGIIYTSRPWEGFLLGIVFTVIFSGYAYFRTRSSLKIEKLAFEVSQSNTALQADIAERKKVEYDLEERNQQLVALQKVSSAVSQSLDLHSVANMALETTLRILDLQAGDVKLLDRDKQELVVIHEYGLPPEQVRYKQSLPNIKVGQGLSGLAAQSGVPVAVEDLYQDKRRFYGNTYMREFRSAIYVPLKVKGDVVGTLSGMSKIMRAFKPADIELMVSIGNMVGISIANARMFEDQKQRNKELAGLQEVSQAVSQSLDLATISKVALMETLNILGLDAGTLRYLDKNTQELILLGNYGLPLDLWKYVYSGPVIKVGEGLTGLAAKTGEPQVVSDLLNDKRRFYGPSYTPDFRSAVYLPLKAKGEVVGVISAMSKTQRTFQPADMELLGSISNMVGIAIANSGLFEQEKQRTKELTALQVVSQAASQSLDLATISKVTLMETLKLMGLDAGAVRLLDKATGELRELCTCGLPLNHQRQRAGLPPLKIGQGIAGIAAQTGEIQVVTDLLADKRRFYGPSSTPDFLSAIYIPLKTKGEVVGVISAMSKTQRTFQPADTELLGSISNMVGIAIGNAQLFDQVETKAEEWQQTFDTMGDGVAIITPDRRILRANKVLANMLGSIPGELVGQHCYQLVHGLDSPLDSCPTCMCLVTKKPCETVFQEPYLGGRWLHMKGAPVLDSNSNVTCIIHTFSDISREKQQQENLDRLYRLSQRLSTTLQLETVADLALNETLSLLRKPLLTAGISIIEDREKESMVIAAVGPYSDTIKGTTVPFTDVQDDIRHLLFIEQRPWIVSDISQVPQEIKRLPAYDKFQAFIALPLVHGTRTTGILFICSAEPWEVGQEQLTLLETFAQQITLAIENARLYTMTDVALSRRVTELLSLTDVLSSATKSLELDNFMEGTLKHAAEALGVERTSIIIFDEDLKKGVVQAAWHLDIENPPGLGMTVEVSTFPLLQEVIDTGQPIVVVNTKMFPSGPQKDLFDQLGLSSSLLIPLMLAGEVIGTMQFNTTNSPKNYSREDISLAQAISGHLASVIQNARLYERTEKERSALNAVLSSMAEGLVVVDSQHNVAYCNQSAEGILDIHSKDIVGQPVKVVEDVLVSRVNDAGKLKKQWREMIASRAEHPKIEFELFSNNVTRMVEATIFPIENVKSLSGTGILLRDVTHEHEVDRMKTEFVSLASHEFRTPMTIIYGFAELLLMSKGTEVERRDWVDRIHKETRRLTNIVEDFLNVSRIESGKLIVKQDRVSLKPLISQLATQLNSTYHTHLYQINIPDNFPDVLADTDRLTQVLYNLVDNAAKYSPQGSTVVVSAHKNNDNNNAVIAVTDSGIGISAEDLPRLFTRFHRINRPETLGIRGTGLGLYIAKSLVEMMGGRVWVESQPGKGSTFHFTLPLFDLKEKSLIEGNGHGAN